MHNKFKESEIWVYGRFYKNWAAWLVVYQKFEKCMKWIISNTSSSLWHQTLCTEHPGEVNLDNLGTVSTSDQTSSPTQILQTVEDGLYIISNIPVVQQFSSCLANPLKQSCHVENNRREISSLPVATDLQYSSASLPLQCEQSVWSLLLVHTQERDSD